jgi:hypothetical protein
LKWKLNCYWVTASIETNDYAYAEWNISIEDRHGLFEGIQVKIKKPEVSGKI